MKKCVIIGSIVKLSSNKKLNECFIWNEHDFSLFTYAHSCQENSFRCAYGACVPSASRCDRKRDCLDWSDEDENECQTKLADGACRLPPAKPSTHYAVRNCERCRPGDVVNEGTEIQYRCFDASTLRGNASVTCRGGKWSGELPICLNRKCRIWLLPIL